MKIWKKTHKWVYLTESQVKTSIGNNELLGVWIGGSVEPETKLSLRYETCNEQTECVHLYHQPNQGSVQVIIVY